MKVLRFSPYAWAKLLFLRDRGKTEISCMGITTPEHPNVIKDVRMPQQVNGWATTEFTENGLADFFCDLVEQGLHPAHFGRVWCHTHPGECPLPSGTDVETFKREFSGPNWAIMFILGKTGKTSCRLKHKNHPDLQDVLGEHTEREVPVELAWDVPFLGAHQEVREAWENEYTLCHSEKVYTSTHTTSTSKSTTGQTTGSGVGFSDGFKDMKDGRKYRRSTYGDGFWIKEKGEVVAIWYNSIDEYKRLRAIAQKVAAAKDDDDTDLDILSEEAWKERTAEKKVAGFSQTNSDSETRRPQVTNPLPRRKLTKRERKFLKRTGSLEGFVPPVNPGFKTRVILDAEVTTNSGQPMTLSQWESMKHKPKENEPLQANRNLINNEDYELVDEDDDFDDGETIGLTEQSDEHFLDEVFSEFSTIQELREYMSDIEEEMDEIIYGSDDDDDATFRPMTEKEEQDYEDLHEELIQVQTRIAQLEFGEQAQLELDLEDDLLKEKLADDTSATLSTSTALTVFNPQEQAPDVSPFDVMT